MEWNGMSIQKEFNKIEYEMYVLMMSIKCDFHVVCALSERVHTAFHCCTECNIEGARKVNNGNG